MPIWRIRFRFGKSKTQERGCVTHHFQATRSKVEGHRGRSYIKRWPLVDKGCHSCALFCAYVSFSGGCGITIFSNIWILPVFRKFVYQRRYSFKGSFKRKLYKGFISYNLNWTASFTNTGRACQWKGICELPASYSLATTEPHTPYGIVSNKITSCYRHQIGNICHCLGSGHETMVCAVCLSMFLSKRLLKILKMWSWLLPVKMPTRRHLWQVNIGLCNALVP